MQNTRYIGILFSLICLSNNLFSQSKYDFERIEDNSFLIEEAYNQDPGVIQHISTFQYTPYHKWLYTFTDEWPVTGQKHQLSATIPILKNEATGLGDIALNYRYQAILSERFAFSPRFSLILPTGKFNKGLGSGVFGYQISLPASFLVSTKIVTHYNLGITYIPDYKDENGEVSTQTIYNYGLSVILLLSRNINFMLEAVAYTGATEIYFVNPGVRYAFNLKSGMQIVPGVALPIKLGPSNDVGFFAYFSIEHPVHWLKNSKK